MAKRNLAEVATGAAVLLVAGGFLVFAVANTGRAKLGGTTLLARFENVGSVAPGTDVRMGGVKIGSVTGVRLDPKTYQAVLTFTVPSDLKLPTDSSAVISSGGLLGGSTLSLTPGGADALLKDGDAMTITQSALSIEDLLGKFIFNVGSLADASQKMLQQAEQPRANPPRPELLPPLEPARPVPAPGRSDARNSRDRGARQ